MVILDGDEIYLLLVELLKPRLITELGINSLQRPIWTMVLAVVDSGGEWATMSGLSDDEVVKGLF